MQLLAPSSECRRARCVPTSSSAVSFSSEGCAMAFALQVVKELGDQYAPALTAVQSNASFETGRLIDNANGSAVYIFLAAFDSLKGPQFRYEVTDSTMYCKSMNASVPDAIQAANEFGPDVVLYSLDVSSQSSGLDKSLEDSQGVEGSNGGSDSKLWAFGVVAGVGMSLFIPCPHLCSTFRKVPREECCVATAPRHTYATWLNAEHFLTHSSLLCSCRGARASRLPAVVCQAQARGKGARPWHHRWNAVPRKALRHISQ